MIALLLVSLVASGDPCIEVVAEPHPDKTSAGIYEQIGDRELAASRRDSATYAYQRAVALDADRAHSRVALLALCRASATTDYFEAALKRLDAGDKVGAIDLLRAGQKDQPDPTAALVEGVTLYELGRYVEARVALDRACSNAKLADSARLFLGLIAVHTDDERSASSLLTQASLSADAQVRDRALLALHSLRRSAWLSLDVAAGGGYDSNPALSPSGEPLPGGDWDGFAGVTASGQWAPLGASTPIVVAGANYRKEATLAAFDLGDLYIGGGWLWSNTSFGLRGQYAFDFVAQGGDSYLRTHRGSATGWWNIGRLTLSAGYTLSNEFYIPQDLTGFSGWRHDGEAIASMDLGKATLALGYAMSRDFAAADTWSYLEHGPELFASVEVLPHFYVGADGLFELRDYDQPASAPQHDKSIRARLNATWWFHDSFGLRLSGSYWRNISNIPDFTTTRFVFALDLLYSLRMR